MRTIQLEVSTKKGDLQKLRFLVVQEIPFPCVGGQTSTLAWVNYEGLFSSYGNKAQGIGETYKCYLLADTAPEEIGEDYNRNHFAGYKPYRSYGQPEAPANGGTLTVRGKDLGEMSITFAHGFDWPTIRVNESCAPSATESEVIKAQIVPPLVKFIKDNRAFLKACAITRIKAQFARKLREAREQLDKLEKQAEQATY